MLRVHFKGLTCKNNICAAGWDKSQVELLRKSMIDGIATVCAARVFVLLCSLLSRYNFYALL